MHIVFLLEKKKQKKPENINLLSAEFAQRMLNGKNHSDKCS